MLKYSYMLDCKESMVFEIHDDADSIYNQWAKFIYYNMDYSDDSNNIECDAMFETVEKIISVSVKIDG